MAKNNFIGMRLKQSELDKVNAVRGDKSVQGYIRLLIKNEGVERQTEGKEFLNIISKLEGIDLAKIEEKIDKIITLITANEDITKVEEKLELLAKLLMKNK